MKHLVHILALGTCLAWLLVATTGTAHADVANQKRTSLVFSPHFQVFADIEGTVDAVEATRAFYRGATTFVSNHPEELYLVSQSDLERAVKTSRGFDDKLKIAELQTELGIDKYKKLEVDASREHLQEALEVYRLLNYQYANPERVAEVAMYVALSFIEQDAKTLQLFDMLQTMTLLDPSRSIREGYYPDEVVRVYRDARQSLIRVTREQGPDRTDAERLATFADTDFAVYGYAWPTGEGTHEVALYLYSRAEDRFLQPESLEVDNLDPATLRAAGNRLMSRYLPCFERPAEPRVSTVVDTDGDSPFSLEFGAAYTSFMQYPGQLAETKPWGNLGLSVNARLLLTRDFSVVAGAHFLNSMSDYAGLLASDFITFRGFLGGDMGIDLGDFNLGVQISAEATSLTDFDAYADKVCAAGRQSCGQTTLDAPGLLVGINARPRIIWHAHRQFSLLASVSGSYYVFPLSGREFNFPLTTQMGVSYRF
ncbi:hypothetical protein FIV42_09890 [Persicimonas caeni]|uniref:Uncharacterized protein n=1 Tax=Persicimonas caeni TaxID=2292766 RepID=A0A4Y6PRT8_PERCE|nr:hypothetical protein [Persicimonas caeni]QDG51031.1 hypothetical protein FIV42_09890 [Persicimonas caeni]QED32252.1 hypothetical protein FRD00_09885 [Persicimonas caeni]